MVDGRSASSVAGGRRSTRRDERGRKKNDSSLLSATTCRGWLRRGGMTTATATTTTTTTTRTTRGVRERRLATFSLPLVLFGLFGGPANYYRSAADYKNAATTTIGSDHRHDKGGGGGNATPIVNPERDDGGDGGDDNKNGVVIATEVIAGTDDKSGGGGEKVRALPTCAVCDGEGGGEDGDKEFPTCYELFRDHPTLEEECIENPTMTKCNVVCRGNGTLPGGDDNNGNNGGGCTERPVGDDSLLGTLWPPLNNDDDGRGSGRSVGGRWVQDDRYCEDHRGKTTGCFLGRYRYDVVPGGGGADDENDCRTDRGRRGDEESAASSSRGRFYPMDGSSACELLRRHGVSDVKITGDSLMRNLWQGLAIVLAGDMDYAFVGAGIAKGAGQTCAGAAAFSDPCRPAIRKKMEGLLIDVCPSASTITMNGTTTTTTSHVRLRFQENVIWMEGHFPTISSEALRGKTLHVYGVGNHPGGGTYDHAGRLGIYNATSWYHHKWSRPGFEIDHDDDDDGGGGAATEHRDGTEGGHEPYSYFWNRPNKPRDYDLKQQQQAASSSERGASPPSSPSSYFVWVPPHYRQSVGRFDESNTRALRFLRETHRMFESRYRVPTINSFDMTRLAAEHFCRRCRPGSGGGGGGGGSNSSSAGHFRGGRRRRNLKVISPKPDCRYYARGRETTATTDDTSALAAADTCNPTTETFDGFHYGRSINVWKSHLLLYHFKHMLSKYQ